MFYESQKSPKVVVRRDRPVPAPPPRPTAAERWPALAALFQSTPVLPGEDEGAYRTLVDAIFVDLAPTDSVEAIWTKEVADMAWQALSLQRARAHLIRRRRKQVVNDFIPRRLVPGSETDKTHRINLEHYADGDPDAEAEVHGQLARKGFTPVDVVSQVQVEYWPEIARFDESIGALGARRDRLLRSMERRRKDFAERARRALGGGRPDTIIPLTTAPAEAPDGN